MGRSPEADREFWREVLIAGGSSQLPRWSGDPDAGLLETEVRLSGELVSRLRMITGELAVSLSSVLLAGHARVLAALCGRPDVVVGYVARGATPALPCRLDTGCRSWRELLAESFCVESAVLTHRAFPVDALRAVLGVAGPAFETVFDPTGCDGEPSVRSATGVALWVGVTEHADGLALRLRCRGEVWDAQALARVGGYHLRALESLASDVGADHSRTCLLPDEESYRRIAGMAGRGVLGPTGDPGGQTPLSAAEERVAAAWAAVLGVPRADLGRREHFFDRGGTSLSAVKLAIILNRAVSHRDVTEHPTLGELADLLDRRTPRQVIEQSPAS